jgi:hypothetical protein
MTTAFPQINTSQPEAITYQSGELAFTILGGIRLEGLDRLRVTLKVELTSRQFRHYTDHPDIANLAVRQSLDLYNHHQTEKFARLVAERLEVGSMQVLQALGSLTDQLERYRLQQHEARQQATIPVKTLTEAEQQQAIAFLQAPGLLERTNELIGQSGVVGEELNRLIMYLVFTSRKAARPLHVISFGSSGTGKSHLQEKVSNLFPDEDKIEITALTENAFYYFDKGELGHKLVLIEDMDGVWSALYPLRELQSKQRISKTVTVKDRDGHTRTIHLKVHGPVSIAGCTTHESLYEDNANRCFLLQVDESMEQDERVMDYQRRLSAGKINTAAEEQARILLQHAQRVLQPVTVRNPYAEQLKIPREVFKQRRTNVHYLSFIEVITFYKQYQRERKTDAVTGESYIATTIEDIQEANALMKPILLRKSDELSGATRGYFEQLKVHLQSSHQSIFTNSSIRSALRIPLSTVKRHHAVLLQAGYIRQVEHSRAKAHQYEVLTYEEYVQLQQRIVTVLDEIAQQLASPIPAHVAREPAKRRKMK